MPRAKKDTPETSLDNIQPSSRSPQTLLQRISSLMSSLPLRNHTPRIRPISAPSLARLASLGRRSQRSSCQDDRDPLLPKTNITQHSDEPCPYDPEHYYTFPRVEKRHYAGLSCDLCLRKTRSAAETRFQDTATASVRQCSLSRPCTRSRSGRPCAHLTIDRLHSKSPPGAKRNSPLVNVAEGSTTAVWHDSLPKVRFDMTPRRISGSRLPPLNTFAPRGVPSSSSVRPPTRRGLVPEAKQGLTFDKIKDLVSSPFSDPDRKQTPSPKIHHVLGRHDHPYVHRHEAEEYLAAMEAAGLSPALQDPVLLTAQAAGKRARRESDAARTDFSDTVFYPRGVSPGASPKVSPPKPQSAIEPVRRPSPRSNALNMTVTPSSTANSPTIQLTPVAQPSTDISATETIQASGSITVHGDGQPISVNLELEASNVYRTHRRAQRSQGCDTHDGDHGDGKSSTTQSTGSTLPDTPSTIGGVRMELRGGNAMKEYVPRLRGGDRKKCSVPTIGVGMKNALQCLCSDRRAGYDTSNDDEDLPPPRVHRPYLRPVSNPVARLPFNRSRITEASGKKIIGLRGGGSWIHSSKLEGSGKLPWGLYWLAGGRGPPVTARAWNMQKPTKRMSGLVGMAIYGHKSGMLYTKAETGRSVVGGKAGESGSSSSESRSSGSSSSASSSGEAGSGDATHSGTNNELTSTAPIPAGSENPVVAPSARDNPSNTPSNNGPGNTLNSNAVVSAPENSEQENIEERRVHFAGEAQNENAGIRATNPSQASATLRPTGGNDLGLLD